MNALVLLLLMHPVAFGQVEADESVTAGRGALDNWWPWDYPWYDPGDGPESDGVQRVNIRKPRDWSWLWNWLGGLWPNWDWSWLWGWLPGGNWRSLFGMPRTALQWSVWIVVVLLLALLVFLVVRKYRRRRARHARSKTDKGTSDEQDDADRIEALPFPVRRGRSDLLGEARRHYQEGNYGQAIVYLFSFQLVRLDRQQIIRLTKGKTNRQYLREVGPRAALRRLVEQTMVAFEDVFFGNHRLERTRFESCWSRLDEFESLAGEGAG